VSRAEWLKFLVTACAALLLGGVAFSGAGNGAAHAADFPVLSPSDPDYPQHVDFVTVCQVVKTAAEDPIVFPGTVGRSHDHVFSGNTSINPNSTAEELVRQGTNCGNSGDTASYWMPDLLVDGKPVKPYQHRAYYRAGTRDTSKLKTIPFGLKVVAGNAMATSAQSAGVAGFQCRIEGEGATVRKQSLPPNCGSEALLEASVVFPNCWDGKNLDAADHRSHMSYAKDFVCDAAHPVQIPQLTLAARFPKGMTNGTITLVSMNSPLTLHADFFNAWKPAAMAELMEHCIYANRFCETVSDTRMPPGMTTTNPAGALPTATATTEPAATAPAPATTTAPAPATTTAPTQPAAPAPAGTSSPTVPALTVDQPSATRLRVQGVGYPANVPSKVVATLGSSTRSAVVQVGPDGRFSVEISIPKSWTGSAQVSATADAGKVSARASIAVQ